MTDVLDRWRLVLGRYSERSLGGLGCGAERMGAALDELYGRAYQDRGVRGDGDGGPGSGAGLGASAPYLVEWLGEVRELFPQRTVEVIEKHAIDRFGLTELVTDPETLARLEPNEDLLRTVLTLKGLMSPPALAVARRIVAQVVDELMRRIRQEIAPTLTGRLNRFAHSPVAVAANFDPVGTIRANLKHTRLRSAEPVDQTTRDTDRHRLVIEKALFFERNSPRLPWDVIVCVDQSGSMVGSVIHSAVTAAILAGLPWFRLRLVVFDTSVVDLTDHVDDPLEVLMTVQLGGGTDITQAVRYCSTLVENPHRTAFVLVTDFCEGASATELVAQVRQMAESRVTMIGLAALDYDAPPHYDKHIAAECVDAGMPVACLTPADLASWLVEVTS
ncbi:MAG: VWA domain-containing protein [Micrococcales bacterium]|nr:VWA domain-containing protein [Micrococcales bacterium]